MRGISGVLTLLVISGLLSGCGTYSKQGAASGAKSGAVGGLVAGAVGSLFWGGNALENAVASAAVGAASGAAIGAMSGNERDKAVEAIETQEQRNEELRQLIGQANFDAGEALARCKHVSAISKAERAFAKETDAKRKGYALLIKAVAAEESGNSAKADEAYSQWGQMDPAMAERDKARSQALASVLELQQFRQKNGLPAVCT